MGLSSLVRKEDDSCNYSVKLFPGWPSGSLQGEATAFNGPLN